MSDSDERLAKDKSMAEDKLRIAYGETEAVRREKEENERRLRRCVRGVGDRGYWG